MLYNTELKKKHTRIDCYTCKYFDKKLLKCKGIGKNCMLYDEPTETLIDPATGLVLKKEK